MNIRTIARATVICGAIAGMGWVAVQIGGSFSAPDVNTDPVLEDSYIVAAAGRIEPLSEEIELGAAITGLLREVRVKEGDVVDAGQIIAVVENDEFQAELERAEAVLRLKQAELRRIVTGARQAERDEALATVQEWEAVMQNARRELERRRGMFKAGTIPQEELEQAQRDYDVGRARYAAAAQRYTLINDPAREEDVTIAEAEVAEAQALRDAAKAAVEKTLIRSPISGTILRVHRRPGELLTVYMQMPIATVGDVSRLYARADVDEADIGTLRTGQRAYVKADAFGEQQFWGRVIRIGRLVGKKNVKTEQPTERLDTKVLETLIELDNPNPLVPGLRVEAFILPEFKHHESVADPES